MAVRRLIIPLSILLSLVVSTTGAGAIDDVGRIAGASRRTTAVEISKHVFAEASVVYLAREDAIADALAAGSLDAGPLLLVPSCGPPPPEVAAEIARLGARTVFAIGGPGAVCDELLDGLVNVSVGRIAGPSRFATAVEVSKTRFPVAAPEVYIANAYNSPDGIVAGTLGLGPTLVVPPTGLPPRIIREEIERLSPDRLIVIGGESAVSEATVGYLAALLDDPENVFRAAGGSRYDTSVAVAEYWSRNRSDAEEVYLARGDSYADALAAGTLTKGPILLVPSCGQMPESVRLEILKLDPDTVYALGGSRAVCNEMLEQARG
jgi:putative cell wall-binding protein